MLRLFLASALLASDCSAAARTRPSAERLLGLPGRLLELPWWPIGRALDFAQRHALFTRLEDLFYFNEQRTAGWFPNVGSTGSGRGAGLLFFHNDLFGAGQKAEADFAVGGFDALSAGVRYAGSLKARRRGGLSIDYFRAGGDMELYARAGPELGWKTSATDRVGHSLTRLRGRFWGERRLGALHAGVFAAADDGEVGSTAAGPPPPVGLQGFSRRVILGGGGLRFEWNGAPGEERAVRGARLAAELEAQASGDGTHGYSRHFLDGQVFVPLLAPRRAPFFVMPLLDCDNRLRGFRRLRYRAPGAATVSAEYRYPVWVDWDAFYFVDAGQSYERENELRFSRWASGHGPGLRFLSDNQLLLTAHLGFTAEGRRFDLSLGKVF